ncbi:MAG: LLM class flavin-dependent oxidoreductase [Chloroflexi bacterium]|nr:LLM class flavin-dependent oxidoreductase [Chloroflexota bacterium]MCI0780909.1 LLM class flavin-dependent oxidoreductase [Chloroflexota bacterium]MCI0786120.1 LLM class flavin-dependent oxidoreductase [Chloroflexota bacterium]MCI0792191.1 LLM class flavin-dependent oxidoreductase [Chloroflexota bacterium]MCI0799384.1 LLM class flavin-dependent oxidoreductase [Chloroflexota bacterium]
MITKFDSLFAGHVDMDNVGYAGTAVNDRSFSDEHLATVFDKTEAIAKLLDRLGFDTFWMAEHHFQPEGYECIPNLLLLHVHLAHLTQNIKLGCAFNIAPMWHPLRLAEDFATADILTGGRVVFGVGRGYHTREVESFGNPLLDQDANRELFEEQVDIMFKAFNERSFSHHGTYYDIPPKVPYRGYELEEITLVPRPANLPVECWQPIQGGTQRALDFMAKHRIKGIIGGGVAEGGVMDATMQDYQAALQRTGRDVELGEDISVGFHFFLANTQEEGIKLAAKYYEENVKMFGPLRLHRGLSEQQMLDIADPARAPFAGLPSLEDAVKSGAVLCGPPERIIEQLKVVEEKYPGLDRVGMSHPVGTPQALILEQLEWLAQEVMPAFKGKVEAAVPAD